MEIKAMAPKHNRSAKNSNHAPHANSAHAEEVPSNWTAGDIGVPPVTEPADLGVPLTAASVEANTDAWDNTVEMEKAIGEANGTASPDPLAFDPDIYYSGKDPTGWKNMMKHPNSKAFLKALDDEMDQMLAKNAWEIVERSSLPAGTKILDMMVKYTTKRDSKGKFVKFKARACIRGDQQTEKGETYAPTAHSTTIRLLLALAASLGMELSTMDISSAFLIENLGDGEDIYVRLPTEYTKQKGMGNEVIVKLNKSVYGLCQAPRIFHQGLDKHLKDQGYTPCVNDPCLYYRRMADGSMLYAAIHVDDILVASSSLTNNNTFKSDMAAKYDITWSEVAENYTGYLITRDRTTGSLTISQPAYARHVVEQCGLTGCIISDTPGDHIQFTGTSKGKGDSKKLRQIVGLLQYLTNTRFDIITALNKVAKNMHDPTEEDMIAGRKIVRYIAGTLDAGITFNGTETKLFAWSDASLMSEKELKSRTGYNISLGIDSGSFIAVSQCQTVIALSSQESEIMALSEATRAVRHFQMLLAEMGYDQIPTEIFEDNQAAISFANGQADFDRTKHIGKYFRFCAEQARLKNITVRKIGTADQKADILTKLLNTVIFKKLRNLLLNQQIG